MSKHTRNDEEDEEPVPKRQLPSQELRLEAVTALAESVRRISSSLDGSINVYALPPWYRSVAPHSITMDPIQPLASRSII